ncbi:hypothetical protein MVEN_02279500 [Mycena venus]|uniref:Uncharacterized protein n=1 Tax=Mycena venus TaxID=2733690 RepID=A0A8H6X4T9_9AGAR|nr:hypothetical protein MVEN_02279500 [Mycena venus]
MPADRQRVVYKKWDRDPKGKLLEKPPPKGSRTENNITWGHTLDDFYWMRYRIPRIPGVNVLTIWSRSMIKEFGENYLNEKHEKEPEPRRLRPWPVLTLPSHIPSSTRLGYIDEGCGDNHEHSWRRVETETSQSATREKAKLICPTLAGLECCPINYFPLEAPENLEAIPACVAGQPSTLRYAVPSLGGCIRSDMWRDANANATAGSSDGVDPALSAALNANSPAVAPPPPHPAYPAAQEPTPTSNGVVAESFARAAPISIDTNPTSCVSSTQATFETCSTTPTSATLVAIPTADILKMANWTDSTDSERINAKIALPTATYAAPVVIDVVVPAQTPRTADPIPDAPEPTAPAARAMDVDAPKIGGRAGDEDKPGDATDEVPPAEATEVDAPRVEDGAGKGVKAKSAGDVLLGEIETGHILADPKDYARAAAAEAEATAELCVAATPAAVNDPVGVVDAHMPTTFQASVEEEDIWKCPPPPPPTPEPIFDGLPKLEEFIPEEYFPDVLYVNDPDKKTAISHNYKKPGSRLLKAQTLEPVPRKYKRVWPRFVRDTEPATAFNTDPNCASIKVPPLPAASGPTRWSIAPRTSPPTVPKPSTNLRIAHLNLSSAPCLGVGNHSAVFRAGLRLPYPLSARSPTGEVTVAAKTGFSGDEARKLLSNEGKIYGAFPKHLQEDWCGLNLVAPITHPVPVHAVVPKFYGYYVPVMEDVERAKQEAVHAWKQKKKEERLKKKEKAEAKKAKAAERGGHDGGAAEGKDEGATQGGDDDEEKEDSEEQNSDEEEEAARKDEEYAVSRFESSPSYKAWHRLSPILLLEECGEPISPSAFTADERSECFSLALRLHCAEFTQNSFYVRNILRQPGPLTVAPPARSDKTPSFRIIDHGRGRHWLYQLETTKKENAERRRRNKSKAEMRAQMNVPTEEEMKVRMKAEEAEDEMDKKHLEAAAKSWSESRDYEVCQARSELQILDSHY